MFYPKNKIQLYCLYFNKIGQKNVNKSINLFDMILLRKKNVFIK